MLGVVEREPPLRTLQMDKVDICGLVWAPISSKLHLCSINLLDLCYQPRSDVIDPYNRQYVNHS